MSLPSSLFRKWKRDAIVAGGAGLVSVLFMGSVSVLLGEFSGAEARRLVEATIPTSRLFCATVMTVSATILALMLTIVGLGSKSETKLADAHYHRIVTLAFYDTLLFALSTGLMIIQCVPVYESKEIPGWWYTTMYYLLLSLTSAVGGAAITVISLLYLAVKDVIQVVGLNQSDHPAVGGGGERGEPKKTGSDADR